MSILVDDSVLSSDLGAVMTFGGNRECVSVSSAWKAASANRPNRDDGGGRRLLGDDDGRTGIGMDASDNEEWEGGGMVRGGSERFSKGRAFEFDRDDDDAATSRVGRMGWWEWGACREGRK